MTDALPPAAQKVQAALRAAGSAAQVVETTESARTAKEAAAALGCTVGQIVKSLVFRGAESGRAYLILASGANRVDEPRLGRRLGEKLERADADFVRDHTGYAIGGVPPIAHAHPSTVILDQALFALDPLWAAGGTPRTVFCTSADELRKLTHGRVVPIG
ncbi:MAG: YbaK/EbsC family protein [Rhodobacteraceae bacterium]|nr:MAG: YbaK/EbsC family protein [Paracoccaceae bacterium]